MSTKLRLDKNESPYGLPDHLLESAKKAFASIEANRYPDPTYSSLRESIGNYVGLYKENIVPGNGGDEILWLAFAAYVSPGDRVLTLNPSFSQYEHMCKVFKAERLAIPMTLKNDSIEVDEDKFLRSLRSQNPSLVLLDSPNNPTGVALTDRFIHKVLDSARCPVLIDEAYGEFSSHTFLENQDIDDLPESTMILKTLSKAWGIAGLRVGYCVTSQPTAHKLNGLRSPFNVNLFSQAIALELLKDRSWMDKKVKAIVETRERLFSRIKKGLKEWQVFPGQGNFLLVKLPDEQRDLLGYLRENRIEIKGFDLPWEGYWARITVGTDEEMEKLIDAVEKV